MSTNAVKMIKSDSVIDIKIGAGFYKRVSALFFYMASLRSEEDMTKYKEEAEKTAPNFSFTEEWMDHFTTLSILISEIEKKAIEQGCTYDKEMDDVIKEIEHLTNKEEN